MGEYRINAYVTNVYSDKNKATLLTVLRTPADSFSYSGPVKPYLFSVNGTTITPLNADVAELDLSALENPFSPSTISKYLQSEIQKGSFTPFSENGASIDNVVLKSIGSVSGHDTGLSFTSSGWNAVLRQLREYFNTNDKRERTGFSASYDSPRGLNYGKD
jgi:hypothetical protein